MGPELPVHGVLASVLEILIGQVDDFFEGVVHPCSALSLIWVYTDPGRSQICNRLSGQE